MINLTKRQNDILWLLCQRDSFIRMEELAQEFSVSTRTLRNDLQQIAAFVNERGCSLTRKHGIGICIQSDKRKRMQMKKELETKNVRVFNREERRVLISAMLLTTSRSTFQELGDSCYVSRQTIINSFQELEGWLAKEHLNVEKISGVGLALRGEEVDVRRLFMQVVSEAYCFDAVMELIAKNIALDEQVIKIDAWLIEIEQLLQITFVNRKRLHLIIAYTLYRIRIHHTLLQDSYQPMTQAQELSIICEYLHEHLSSIWECQYLSTVILSERMNQVVLKDVEPSLDDEAHQIARYLVESLKHLHKQEYTATDEIMQGLTLHLRSAIYRCRNHIQIRNELLEQIKVSISLMYEFTRKQLHAIEGIHKLCFDENETAYIAMYIASIYESSIQQTMALRILLICSFGLATSSILKTRICQVIADCVIEGPLSQSQAQVYLSSHRVDLIVSTNAYEHENIPVITVNPLLNQQDMETIKDKLYQYSYAKMCSSFLHSYADTTQLEEGKHYLRDYVVHKNIQIIEECAKWERAIQLAARPLLEDGYIEQRYVDRMIHAVYNYGTYMVLTPGVAYVHAGVDDGIMANCSALLVIKEPLYFGIEHSKRVHAIVILGIKHKEDSDLLNLAYIFEKKRNMEVVKSQDVNIELLEDMHD